MADALASPYQTLVNTALRTGSTDSATAGDLWRIDPEVAGLFERGLNRWTDTVAVLSESDCDVVRL